MFHAEQFRLHVVRPTLVTLGMHSTAAEDLVLGTCAQESGFGKYVVQMGNGPALGVFQMEPATHDDIWLSYLRYQGSSVTHTLKRMIGSCWWDDAHNRPRARAMVCDLAYATAMCRIHYRRKKDPLPAAGDWMSIAAYWKRHYNTPLGKGTEGEFIASCERAGLK